jgi:hypothetical protein
LTAFVKLRTVSNPLSFDNMDDELPLPRLEDLCSQADGVAPAKWSLADRCSHQEHQWRLSVISSRKVNKQIMSKSINAPFLLDLALAQ